MSSAAHQTVKQTERAATPGTRNRPLSSGSVSRFQRGVGLLQRSLGNRAVGAVVQRSPEDVYRLVVSFQGRLRKGPGIDAAAFAILNEITDFARRFTDHATRKELAYRADMILTDWRIDPDLAAATKSEAERVLIPLLSVPAPPAAVQAPPVVIQNPPPPAQTPAGNAPPKAVAKPGQPAGVKNPPTVSPPGTTGAKVTLTPEMSAVDVLKVVAAGNGAGKLRVRWFVSSFDKAKGDGCYSTAYDASDTGKWEIHVHRKKDGKPWNCTVQKKVSVGNTGATRGMELTEDKYVNLHALGIPATHNPKTQQRANEWRAF